MARTPFSSRRAIRAVFPFAGTLLVLWLAISLAAAPLPKAPALPKVTISLNLASPGMLQTRGKRKPPAAPPLSRPAPEVPVPFRPGERLAYRVLWSKYSVNAATVEFQALEHGNFFGQAAWHFRALAHTIDTMRVLYPLDDQFDSYTETANLTSVEYETYLREQGKQQNNSWRMTPNGGAASADSTVVQIAPGTRDPVGLLYALRAADWKKTPEFRAPVFEGRHLYDIVARLEEPAGQATVPAGQFAASRIEIRVFEHGQELTDMRFAIWLAQDAARTPVLIEADVPIGTARVELTVKP
jgi:Protein of unknown function (DUF3108)